MAKNGYNLSNLFRCFSHEFPMNFLFPKIASQSNVEADGLTGLPMPYLSGAKVSWQGPSSLNLFASGLSGLASHAMPNSL